MEKIKWGLRWKMGWYSDTIVERAVRVGFPEEVTFELRSEG